MKGIIFSTILAAATVAIAAATVSKLDAASTDDRGKMLDYVVKAYQQYRSRREYLRTLDPYGGAKITEGKKMLDRFKRAQLNEEGKGDTVNRVTSIQNTVDEDLEKNAKLREECLAREWPFDEDGYLARIGDCDIEDLRCIYRQIVDATNEIESCIHRTEASIKAWKCMYKLSSLVCDAGASADDTEEGVDEDGSDNGDGDSKK